MNARRPESKSAARRRREARIWHMERRSNPQLPPVAARAWEAWKQDPANFAEYQAFEDFLSLLSSSPMPPLPSTAELLADTGNDVPDRADEPDGLDDLLRTPRVTRDWRASPRVLISTAGALAASIAVVWVGPGALGWVKSTFVPAPQYETAAGQVRQISLEEHSVATLAGSTRLKVLFSATHRRVILEQGEVLFNVTHNASAPFEVHVGSSVITDLGTTFDVHRYPHDVEVAVTEGAVKVSVEATVGSGVEPTPNKAEAQTLKVQAGEQLHYNESERTAVVRASALEEVTSWLYGTRLYRDKPLVKVIQDMQLYLSRPIDLDPDMSALRFTGRFDKLNSAQAEQWVRGLPNIYPIEIDDLDPRILRIRCRVPGCADAP